MQTFGGTMKALISPLKLFLLTAVIAASFTPSFAKAKDWDTEDIEVRSSEMKQMIETAFYLTQEEPSVFCDYAFLNQALIANSGKLGSFIADENGKITKESIDEKVFVAEATDSLDEKVLITLNFDEYKCLVESQGFSI